MSTNVGVLDAAVRLVIGTALLAWSYGKFDPALPIWLSWMVWATGAVLALTGLFRYCPLYALADTHSCALYPDDDAH